MSCFVQNISVGPDFDWSCPFCGMCCDDDIPVVVDKLMVGIVKSHKANSKKEFFQVTSDGQLCDDSESESESEIEIEGDDNEEEMRRAIHEY